MKKSFKTSPTRRLTGPLIGALLAANPIMAHARYNAPQAEPALSPNQIVAQAGSDEWIAIARSDILVMDLAPDADGNKRRVVIQLMPEPFSQGWIRNMRKLAAAKWWDGTSINRVQDNYVTQWGDAGYDNPESGETEQKPLPDGLETVPESEYYFTFDDVHSQKRRELSAGTSLSQAEGDREHNRPETRVFMKSNYASHDLFSAGWPLGWNGSGFAPLYWPVHCYGMVGVGRNLSPDTGSGAELYTVIGHAPRHLDRNIALVGRIIEGMEHMSSLPRGKGILGFYEDPAKRVPIVSVRLATDLSDDEEMRFEYLDTEGQTFAKYADARANRRDPFFNVPADGADICNITVPVRRVVAQAQ